MALKSDMRLDETGTNDINMVETATTTWKSTNIMVNFLATTWLPTQYAKRRVLKFGLGTYVPSPPPAKRAAVMLSLSVTEIHCSLLHYTGRGTFEP